MNKTLLALFLGSVTTVFAQPDISVTLTNPVASSTVNAGTAFNFDVTIANTGTVAIDAQDSIIFAPVINGSLLGTSGGGQVIYLEQQAIPVGSSVNLSRQLNISGGSSGAWNFCALAVVTGNGWSGVTESDTTNNESCVNVTYNAGAVGISELHVTEATDNSYFSDGIYHVQLKNIKVNSDLYLTVYNIAGVEVFRAPLQGNSQAIVQDVALTGLSSGVYLVEIKGLVDQSVKKIVVQ